MKRPCDTGGIPDECILIENGCDFPWQPHSSNLTATVPAGEKIIRISAVRTTGETDQYGEPVTESYIPAKYNTRTELKRTVAPGRNTLNFDL